MTAAMVAQTALNNEGIVFAGFGLFMIGLILWFDYVIRRWSWIPRNRHNRQYREKF